MTVEEAVVARLLAASAVRDLVVDRVSRHTRDQDAEALPAITYEGTGLEEIVSLEGATGAGRLPLQVDAWAADGDAADALSIAAAAALRAGNVGDGINAVFRKSKIGAVQDPEVSVWRVRSVFDVHYSAAVAA